jgi:DNA relaxase NicK
MAIRFDGYTATTLGAKPADLVALLMRPGDVCVPGRGFHTFGERIAVKDHTGSEIGSVSFGGRQGERVGFEVKGERSPDAVEALRAAFDHRCTRVDSCADFDSPGAFERVLEPVMEVKRKHRLYGEARGDWDDYPEKGRTQYLGAASSVVKCRLYEKGKQPEYAHLVKPDWVRIEVQVRPKQTAREDFSSLTASQVWGASKWSRELAAAVLAEHVDPHPAGTVYRLSDRDRKLQWMLRQYGPSLVSLAADCGGWDVAGLTLREMLAELQASDAKAKAEGL